MADDLKERVPELAAIAKECPENLQTKCFELLLEDLLASRAGRVPAKPAPPPAHATVNQPGEPPQPAPDEPAPDESNQQDVKMNDLVIRRADLHETLERLRVAPASRRGAPCLRAKA
jgi:hypothetical protein